LFATSKIQPEQKKISKNHYLKVKVARETREKFAPETHENFVDLKIIFPSFTEGIQLIKPETLKNHAICLAQKAQTEY